MCVLSDCLPVIAVQQPDGSFAIGKRVDLPCHRNRHVEPIAPSIPIAGPSLAAPSLRPQASLTHTGDRLTLSAASLQNSDSIKVGTRVDAMVFSDYANKMCFDTVLDCEEITSFFYSKVMRKLSYILKYLQSWINRLDKQADQHERETFLEGIKNHQRGMKQNEQLIDVKKNQGITLLKGLYDHVSNTRLASDIVV